MAPLDLNDLAVFVRVVDRAGFARAARDMRVPTSTVSRAIARLETSLGARLVQRTTRSVTPTAEGRAFYAEVAPAVATLHEAARQVDGADEAPRGRLRITAPADLGPTFLARVLVQFVQKYPRLTVDVELTGRQVNLVQEGFDVALRAALKLPDSTLVAKRVGDAHCALYASVGYARLHGVPTTIEELSQHPCVLFRGRDGAAELPLHGPEGEVRVVLTGPVGADDFAFVRSAALYDGGIALLPMFIAGDDVAAGRLVRVLPAYTALPASFYILYAGVPKVPAKIVAFRDFVAEAFTAMNMSARAPAPTAPALAATKKSRSPRP